MKAVLEFFHVDRCGLLLTLQDRSALQVTHVQYVDDHVMRASVGTVVSRTTFPWAFERLFEKRQVVAFSSTDDLPPEAKVDRQSWIERGTRSTLLIPIFTGGSVVYTIVIDAMKSERVSQEEYFPRLRFLGEILVNALERRNSEQALKTAEKKFRSIFEGALEGIFESTYDGKPLTANASLSRMLGYDSPEELILSVRNIGKDVWVSEQERADFAQRLEKQGIILKHECRFLRRDGSEIWVSLSTRLATGPDGQTFYSGFVEDITERRRAEDALGERLKFEELLSDLSARFVNIPPDRVDSDTHESVTTKGIHAVLSAMGYEVVAIVDDADSALKIAHHVKPDLIILDISQYGETAWISSAEKIREHGEIPFLLIVSPSWRDYHGLTMLPPQFDYYILPLEEEKLQITINMVLKKYALEIRLKKSEERYRTIAELGDDMIFIVNRERVLEYANSVVMMRFSSDSLNGDFKKTYT